MPDFPPAETSDRDRRRDELLDRAWRGELARRRLHEEYGREIDVDGWIASTCATIDAITDMDRFERSVILDIALLPETGE